MQAYRSLFIARFNLLLQYRAAALAGIATQLFWGCLKVMVLEAFFRNAAPQPMSLSEAVGYIWLGQSFLFAVLPWSGDREVQKLIQSGAVSYDLLRPMDLYNFWFIRALAMRVTPVILRAVPILLTTLFLLPLLGLSHWALTLPTPEALLAFAIAFIGAILLCASITMLLTISMMWTLSGEGVNSLFPSIITIFSGMIIPLPFFPDWTQPILHILPFSGLLDQPFRLFTGNLSASALGGVLLHQSLWSIGLILLGRFLVSRGVKKLVIQGG
jgi:ABC-2 type transport system permease protein